MFLKILHLGQLCLTKGFKSAAAAAEKKGKKKHTYFITQLLWGRRAAESVTPPQSNQRKCFTFLFCRTLSPPSSTQPASSLWERWQNISVFLSIFLSLMSTDSSSFGISSPVYLYYNSNKLYVEFGGFAFCQHCEVVKGGSQHPPVRDWEDWQER